MNRRGFVFGFGAAVAFGWVARARAATAIGPPWRRAPPIAVISAPGDPRVALVEEAAAFWNRMLAELGSGFRLGAVGVSEGSIPSGALGTLSGAALSRGPRPSMPDWLRGPAGRIVVALSDEDFISFSLRWADAATALVGIKNGRSYPLTLPNVARNVIAHEMGHAIGLGHDSDPALLMCGRPASCRPDAFQSATARYFPLAADEKALLLSLYPPDWRAS